MCVHRQHALVSLASRVPNLDGPVHRARREHRGLRGTPLDILHARAMAQEGRQVHVPAGLRRMIHVNVTVTVARRQRALVAATPVHRVSLRLVTTELEERPRRVLLVCGAVTAFQSCQLRRHVVNADDSLVRPRTDNLRTVGKTLPSEGTNGVTRMRFTAPW